MTITSKSDLLPLLPATKSNKQSRTTNNIALKKHIYLRDTKLAKSDKCGRVRLMFFIIILFSFMYLFNFTKYMRQDNQFLVTIPQDNNWPGPKEIKYNNSRDNKPISPIANKPNNATLTVPKGYVVYGPKCQMLDFDPHASDVMNLFHLQHYSECTKKQPITHLIKNYTTGEVILHYEEKNQKKYFSTVKSCCYQEVHRIEANNSNSDMLWKLGSCITLNQTSLLPNTTEFLIVKCKAKAKKPVYVNGHATIRRKDEITERLEEFKAKDTKRPISVLMLGIDSISRLNLIRAMPHTAQTFYDNGWYDLRGYNKIDDNTFPNLMAIFAGYNLSYAFDKCNPYNFGALDRCKLIFKMFQDRGYTTAFAEDEVSISTFNYRKKGFHKPPTDYYFRPFGMAAEKNLRIKMKSDLSFCLGYKHYAEYIYDYALDFATIYKDEPYFGFFWTNTFSHNALSDVSSMDVKIKYYIEELETRGILNTSIVIFFSDHGIRFGPVLQLDTGWYEERLPFIFIWLPEWFKLEHPDIVENLKINRNRLTNPYDLHMTLQHILQLSGRETVIEPAESCAHCQSVFHEVSENRSCSDAEIEMHWCTCTPYEVADKKSVKVKAASDFIIDEINRIVHDPKHSNKTTKCAHLKMKSIHAAKKYKNDSDEELFRLMFYTTPGNAMYEATIQHNLITDSYSVPSTISRLNVYGRAGDCVDSDYLRKYCFCI